MKKRLLSLLLMVCMLLSIAPLEVKAVASTNIYNYAVSTSITNIPLRDTENVTVQAANDGDSSTIGKTYLMNSVQITPEDVKAACASNTDTTVTTTHMLVYAKEGMAIRFKGGVDWPKDTSRPKFTDNNIWYWSWESSSSSNYVVIKDGAAGKQATFPITTKLDSKTYYCNVTLCVVEESDPVLLQEVFETPDFKSAVKDTYSIKNVPVTLYNYDGKDFNQFYNLKPGKYFAFASTVQGENTSDANYASNRGWTISGQQANGGGSVALMGIMKETLVNGLPETSQGQKVDLFSTENIENGKTVYPGVDFQFVYNENTGYYTYNSALNHAQYNSTNNTIELYKQSLAPSDTPNGDSHGNAGFYPFEDIEEAYTNTGYTALTWKEWIEKLEKNAFELIPSQYSTDIVPTSSTSPSSTVDMHYGIQVASDFYLPEGKKLNNQDMIYEFTGDDDLWVYIDGKLVLDIGGGHTHVSGSFNLTTGEVWVEKYTKLAADDGGSYASREEGTDLRYEDNFITGLKDDQMHTIQIFYLERHSGVSNCRMRFNLPLVPSHAVNVSKNLENQNGEDLSVTPDEDYTFKLYTAKDDDDNVDATNFSELKNAPYTVTGSNAPTGTQYTNAENGTFTLKEGQIAVFEGIDRFTEVYAVEVTPNDGYNYPNSTVSVNKGDAVKYTFGTKTETKVMQLNTSINFDFVNHIETQPLTIEKEVVDGTAGLFDPEQNFTFELNFTKDILETGENSIEALKGTEEYTLTDDGQFSLKHNESITIPNVPVNMTFTVSEVNPDSENDSFDNPVFTEENCVSTADTAPAEFEFDKPYEWKMQGDSENVINILNQQRFNLIISKSGISDLDSPAVTSAEETQSTIYEITGPDKFKMHVAIHGNDDIVIERLPIGTYTVKELTDWSWRYEVANGTNIEQTITPVEYNETVSYTNSRVVPFWLSGDSFIRNLFTSITGN